MNNRFRWVNKLNFSRFASVGVAILVIMELINLIIEALVYQSYSSSNLLNLVSPIISILFMLLVCNYFYKSRDNLAYAFYGILYLLIAQYLIPFIFNAIAGLLTGGLSFLFPSLVTAIAIVYFIFIALENRKREKWCLTGLIVCGIIFVIIGILYAIYYLVIYSLDLSTLISADLASAGDIALIVFSMIQIVLQVLIIPSIMFIYPFVLKKERMY